MVSCDTWAKSKYLKKKLIKGNYFLYSWGDIFGQKKISKYKLLNFSKTPQQSLFSEWVIITFVGTHCKELALRPKTRNKNKNPFADEKV